MKRIIVTFKHIGLVFSSLLFAAIPAAVSANQFFAEELVQKSADAGKVAAWSARIVMRLTPKSGSERVRESVISNKLQPGGTDVQRLVRFIAPADIHGTNILIHEHGGGDDDIWIYLPSMKKVRRLLANNRKDSFMGTDFTYTDITTPKVREYVHTLLRQEEVNGSSCYVIESVPKTEKTGRDTGYAKTVNWIRADNYVRVKAELYDLSGGLSKAMQVFSLKEADQQKGKWLMEKVLMQNLQSGHSTLLEFHDIRTDKELGERLFAPNRLDKEQ
jgi:hypothetical protein